MVKFRNESFTYLFPVGPRGGSSPEGPPGRTGPSAGEGMSATAAACRNTDRFDRAVLRLTADWPAWLPCSDSELLIDEVKDPPEKKDAKNFENFYFPAKCIGWPCPSGLDLLNWLAGNSKGLSCFFSFAHVIEEKYQNKRYFMFKNSDCEIEVKIFFQTLKNWAYNFLNYKNHYEFFLSFMDILFL